MNQETIQQLNQININFYKKIEQDFDETRQQPWEGWSQLLDFLPAKNELSVLDIGCGNGRFAKFLREKLPTTLIRYTGVDNNNFLLKQAKAQSLQVEKTFIEIDIVGNDFGFLEGKFFDMIVLFGVLHHIPSFAERQRLLEKASQHLNSGGVLIFSAWQFLSIPSLKQRVIQWQMFPQIDREELEENDFLIDWQRGSNAYRYCHWLDEREMKQLIEPLQLEKVSQFYADGKNGESNFYVVLKNT